MALVAAPVIAVKVKRVIIRQQSIVATMEPEKPVLTRNPAAAVRAAIVSIAKVAWMEVANLTAILIIPVTVMATACIWT
ncbi:MAG: hypothetical protein WCE45_04445 [Sedimentisphaerales bacterium]